MRKQLFHTPIKSTQLIIPFTWKTSWNTFFDEQYLHDMDSLLCITFSTYYIDVSFYFKKEGKGFYFRLEVCDLSKDELGREDNWMFVKNYENIQDVIVDINYYCNQIPLFERTEKMNIVVPPNWKISINTLNDKMLRDHQECLFLGTYENIFIDLSCNIERFHSGIASYHLSVTKPLGDADFNSEILFEKQTADYFLLENDLNFWLNKF